MHVSILNYLFIFKFSKSLNMPVQYITFKIYLIQLMSKTFSINIITPE